MSKLYESRKTNLNYPLGKDEVGYIFKSDNINKIIERINKKMYGSYLVGGVVGTGKSSLLDIAAGYTLTKSLVIHVNFYNEYDVLDRFTTLVLEYLIESAEREKEDSDKELKTILDEIKLKLEYEIKQQIEKKEAVNSEIKEVYKEKTTLNSRLGMKFKKIFTADINTKGKMEDKNEIENKDNKLINMSTTMSKTENDRLEDIFKIVSRLEKRNIIFVFDELDKMKANVLGKLFKRYKKLFVEKNIFSFFIVDDLMYIKYSDNNINKNKIYTYLTGKYYMPLLTFEETIRYCVMMFGEKKYLLCLMEYYNTIGNYRLLNIDHEKYKYIDKVTIIKAYILINVIKQFELSYLEKCYLDLIVKNIKAIIEEVTKLRKLQIEELKKYLKKNKKVIDKVWPKSDVLIKSVIETINKICPNAVKVDSNNNVVIDFNFMYLNYDVFVNAALSQRREEWSKEELDYIQLSDMYYGMNKADRQYTHISYLRNDIIPLKVADNNPSTYEEALINLIKANLGENELQVIILKRNRGEESLFKDDNEYTGIVVVDNGVFQVAYYVDKGCYDSEALYAKKNLINFSEKYGVNVKQMVICNAIDLNKNIGEIVKMYNSDD